MPPNDLAHQSSSHVGQACAVLEQALMELAPCFSWKSVVRITYLLTPSSYQSCGVGCLPQGCCMNGVPEGDDQRDAEPLVVGPAGGQAKVDAPEGEHHADVLRVSEHGEGPACAPLHVVAQLVAIVHAHGTYGFVNGHVQNLAEHDERGAESKAAMDDSSPSIRSRGNDQFILGPRSEATAQICTTLKVDTRECMIVRSAFPFSPRPARRRKEGV
eukprot:CAMPEP_0185541144 /NCGR_PEP_ID=MMETSP1381-20130426/1765_1 /TAXON_ID=298111 /ORGANISM="Pavlova sp., Strain CCMP459" /LENGTH=214 /DNA_ID=CAMNT_0028153043 /DNA_START=527 /DNA_END=1173 /DNA_ORIENTATION=+